MKDPRQPQLASDWFLDCKTEEERQARRDLITNSSALCNVLMSILQRRKASQSPRLSDYANDAAWHYKLAHRNGQSEELDYIEKLLRPLI